MKKTIYLAGIILGLGATSLCAQEAPTSKKTSSFISFASEKEKSSKIKELENKIKIDETDPSFPADELKKEKQQLAEMKKAKIVSTNNSNK